MSASIASVSAVAPSLADASIVAIPKVPPMPSLMPSGRLLRAYFTDAKYEALRMLRAPAFAIPFLILPVPVYLLFGVLMAGQAVAKDPNVGDYLFIGFCVFAAMGPALFGVGSTLAPERDAGLMRLKRALPVPAGSYLLAKLLMSMFFTAPAMCLMIAAGKLAGKITITNPQLLAVSVTLVLGSLPFCALGLLIGAYFSGGAAPGITNLVYLPQIWLGGLFIPLPAFLQKWVVIWPAFHLQQVAVAAAGIGKFQFIPPLWAAAVLLGVTVFCGGLAIRRLVRVG
jgi:ABC-2 type transport system permease protein